MSGGPKRNADRVNTIGVVVVGICGAVLVYVSIVALQAFYSNDIADVQTMADYGGQDATARGLKSSQLQNLSEFVSNAPPAVPKAGEQAKQQTFRIKIKNAMDLVIRDAKVDPANLVPAVGRSDKATIESVYGRPKALPTAPTGAGSGAGSATPPPTDAGSAAPLTGTGTPVDPGAPALPPTR